jgi:methylmalonyl-CoA mutase N-terminal domain/subunit
MSETKQSKEMNERKTEFRTTIDGPVVSRVYTPDDLVGLNQEDTGLPGEYPFTRHIMPNGLAYPGSIRSPGI